MGFFSYRCAPIQVGYLGYPGTTGAGYMDYLIADEVIVPPSHQIGYSEKIVYLPNSYQVNDAKRKIQSNCPSKIELGLPETGFIYCCFNNNYKFTPEIFDIWMQILNRVDGSVLWLFQDNGSAKLNLKNEAYKRGIEPDRLIFANKISLPLHLARHQHADLFLDTFPCNAHTTASDALWAGLPILTLTGRTFSSRVAASLLKAIQLPELITFSPTEYFEKAVYLAQNPTALHEIKKKLMLHRSTTPLFNTHLFAHHLESAYQTMHQRFLDDLRPEHLYILG
jgi:predicted O-linked N-acetylglucosamine transferase (SPINDLY family)